MYSVATQPKPVSLPCIQKFAKGLEGVQPASDVVDVASRIATAAFDKTVEPEITVDTDGALSFDLRLSNGLLILAELCVDGSLDASVFDDERGILVKHIPQATETELIALFD